MKLFDLQKSTLVKIVGYGTLKEHDILKLNEVGVIIGEIIFVNIEKHLSKKYSMIKIENTNIALNQAITKELEVKQVNE